MNGTAATSGDKNHIVTLDFLRGIAALSVVLFHYSTATIASIRPNELGEYFEWGRLGVPVFFVISGFIIPYSMYVSGYTIKNAGRFLLKRLVRIGPPAWIVIGLTIALYYGSMYFQGEPVADMQWPGMNAAILLSNLTFTNSLFGYESFVVIYWTLEIELQFYLLVTILLPVCLHFKNNLPVLAMIIFGINMTGFLNIKNIMFLDNNGLFLLGMMLFMYRKNIIPRKFFIYSVIGLMLTSYAQSDFQYITAGIIALLIIAYVDFSNPVALFFGKISYSLYITHNLTAAFAEFFIKSVLGTEYGPAAKVILLFIYTLIAIGVAWIFYQLFERPFVKLSQKYGWNKKKELNRVPA